jgi:hypothetical protein
MTNANCQCFVRQQLTQADLIDVDNTSAYKEVVNKISNEKLMVVKLIVDM